LVSEAGAENPLLDAIANKASCQRGQPPWILSSHQAWRQAYLRHRGTSGPSFRGVDRISLSDPLHHAANRSLIRAVKTPLGGGWRRFTLIPASHSLIVHDNRSASVPQPTFLGQSSSKSGRVPAASLLSSLSDEAHSSIPSPVQPGPFPYSIPEHSADQRLPFMSPCEIFNPLTYLPPLNHALARARDRIVLQSHGRTCQPLRLA
jgi:hypothetical protein